MKENLKIVKRSGKRVPFNVNNIYLAIKGGFSEFGDTYAATDINSVLEDVCNVLEDISQTQSTITVERIQNIIESSLIDRGYSDVQKAFSEYRERRAKSRAVFGKNQQKLTKMVEGLTKDSLIVADKRENANVNGDTAMGTMLQFGSSVSKEFGKAYMMDSRFADAHDSGAIHIHDLDFLAAGATTTCTQIPLDKLFKHGFNTGHGFLRPPKGIASYSALACIAIQSNQNDQHGGQSIPEFDYYLAPGVLQTFQKTFKQELYDTFDVLGALEHLNQNKMCSIIDDFKSIDIDPNIMIDAIIPSSFENENEIIRKALHKAYERAIKKTDRATYQAMEAFIHNLNTMHCLPEDEQIWVKENESIYLISMKRLFETFKVGKYQAISLNQKSGAVEFKPITAIKESGKDRIVYTLVSNKGQRVRVTDNHRVMTFDDDGTTIIGQYPVNIKSVLAPNHCALGPGKNDFHIVGMNKSSSYLDSHIVLTEEIAEFIGLYLVNGLIEQNTILLSTDLKQQKDYFDKMLSTFLNRNVDGEVVFFNKRNGKETTTYAYPISSDEKNLMQSICGIIENKIPQQILLGTDDIKKAFLKGFFSQHMCLIDNIFVSGISTNLTKTANLLLLSLGICPDIIWEGAGGISLSFKDAKRLGIVDYAENDKPGNIIDGMPLYDEVEDTLFVLPIKYKNISKLPCMTYDLSVADNETLLSADGLFIHNSRAGSQTPFSSINFGTDTSPEGRMVIKNYLLAADAGLGHGETPIFPISIFKVKEGINYNPEDPNYDLLQLSCKVTAKRLFPNFSFIDAPFNLKYYKPGQPDTEIAYMGCVDKDSVISYKVNGTLYVESFEKAWNRIKDLYGSAQYGISSYVDTSHMDVRIWDSHSVSFVRVKKFIKNPNRNNWFELKFTNGKNLLATADHPLPIKDKGRTFVKDMCVEDVVYFTGIQPGVHNHYHDAAVPVKIVSVEPIVYDGESYDVETDTDRFDVNGILSHNCRTRVIGNIVDKKREIVPGRGNLSFTTINLVRLGIKHGIINNEKPDFEGFYKELDDLLDLVKDQLLQRYEIQCKRHVKNFPFLMGTGVWIDSEKLDVDDDLKKVLKHGTLTTGFIGLAECLKALIGKHHGESEEAQRIGIEIIGHMRAKMDEYSDKYHLNFSLIATPSEGTAGKYVKIDREMFGIIPEVTDREYYTNSCHVPVYYPINVHDKLALEAPYHEFTNAGHIAYIELDGLTSSNPEAIMQVVRIMHDVGIGYGAINHPVDRDPVCGYTGIIEDVCPRCGRHEGKGVSPEVLRKVGVWGNAPIVDENPDENSDKVTHSLD